MLYVTSFNKHLYKATGRAMVNSFKQMQPDDELLVFTENNLDITEDNVRCISIDDNEFLNNWLETNKDIIPKIYGGTYVCRCGPNNTRGFSGGHKESCVESGFKRRASHWFRKVVSWKLSLEQNVNEFVWIDCDTLFLKPLPEDLILSQLSKCHVRFHYGKSRTVHNSGIESGMILFDIENGADRTINRICERFSNGSFRKEIRWDDAWMITLVAKEEGIIIRGDMTPKCFVQDPMRVGPFRIYVTHKKGIHWKKFKVNEGYDE